MRLLTLSLSASPSRARRIALCVTLAALAPCIVPELAAAKRVAVLGFKGPAAKAEKAVVKALREEGHQIVGPATWNAASRKARVKGISPAAIAKTAKRTQVAAVVFGTIQKKGKKTFLVLTVHDGRSGSLLETIEIPLKGGKVDKKAEEALAQDLMPVIRRAEGPEEMEDGRRRQRGHPEQQARGEDDERPGEKERGPEGGGKRAHRESRSEGREDERRSQEEVGRETRKQERDEGTSQAKRSFFTAGAGMSLWSRTYNVTPSGTADTYKGQPVPGLRIDGEVYPAALFARNVAADFGIGFLLDMVWLKSELSGGGSKLPTTQLRWGVDLRWRWKFLSKETSPVLRAALQFSQLSFTIDRTNAPQDLNIPDVKYTTFAPVLGINVPLGSKMFALGGSFAFLLAKESGTPLQTTVRGTPWGIEAGMNFDVLPFKWLLIRVQGGIIRYSVNLTPTLPAQTTGMRDLYAGGVISAAYIWE